jgi:hypothetical protein
MSGRWLLVMVMLAWPMLLPLTSWMATRAEAQESKAGQQEGEPARVDLFLAPSGRDDSVSSIAPPQSGQQSGKGAS